MIFDLHVHSRYSSDGVMDVKSIIKLAKKSGLSGIAITDHNTIKGGLKARKYETDEFKVIVGSEVMTTKGEVIGLFLSEEIGSHLFRDVVHEIRDQGGLAVIPHPFDEMRRSALNPTDAEAELADAIEVFNSRCIFQKYNQRAVELARRLKIGQSAGSDAHFGNEIGNAGIITNCEVTDHEDLLEIIRKGDLEPFGRRSPMANHALTKVLKLWRKSGR